MEQLFQMPGLFFFSGCLIYENYGMYFRTVVQQAVLLGAQHVMLLCNK